MPIWINQVATTPTLDILWHAWTTSTALPITPPIAPAQLLHQLTIPNSAALVLATTKGDISAEVAWIRAHDAGQLQPLPTLSAQAQTLAREAALTGPTHVVSTACSSGLVALIDAAHILLDAHATHAVALAYDHAGNPGDFIPDGFAALKATTQSRCRPFDISRDGLALGSAAAACVLSTNPQNPLARVAGWGLASDALHMTAPDRAASGLIRAIHAALAMSNLAPADIDVLFAHGTGTRYNDAMEIVAIDSIFGPRPPRPPAITAVKGLIGHTLGASGLLETALATKILQHQLVPLIVGLVTPERPDLPFILNTPKPMPVRHVLKVASGFGGLNVALILTVPP